MRFRVGRLNWSLTAIAMLALFGCNGGPETKSRTEPHKSNGVLMALRKFPRYPIQVAAVPKARDELDVLPPAEIESAIDEALKTKDYDAIEGFCFYSWNSRKTHLWADEILLISQADDPRMRQDSLFPLANYAAESAVHNRQLSNLRLDKDKQVATSAKNLWVTFGNESPLTKGK